MKIGLIYITIGLMLGFLLNAYLCSPEIEIKEIKAEPIVITKVVAKIDTVYVRQAVLDTVYLPKTVVGQEWIIEDEPADDLIVNTIAVGDTTLEGYGKLDAIYYYPPLNFFDFTFDPEPVKMTTIKYKPKWYEKKEVAFISGALFTGLVVCLVK